MISDLQTIEEIVAIANGKTMGGELGFAFPGVLEVIKLCTVHRIAILGVEIFRVRGEWYETVKMSGYEIEDQEWRAYVKANNALAEDFIKATPAGDDQIYVITTSSWREFCEIPSLKML